MIKVRFNQLDIVIPNDGDPQRVADMVLDLIKFMAKDNGWTVVLNEKEIT